MSSITIKALQISQPIGSFFIGVIDAADLFAISYADVRRMEAREVETYLGIQRELRTDRVKEITAYVNTKDATFPTAVILAVRASCVQWDADSWELTLSSYPGDSETGEEAIPFGKIAKILDGQHRVAGLEGYSGDSFQVNIAIFVEADIAEQANIFATVNLAQTKVNKSLVYDLFELAKSRSPQKTCHKIAVALNDIKESPFHHKIKRLGVATGGRFTETITQAAFVEALLPFISQNPNKDRDELLRGRKISATLGQDQTRTPFRGLFVREEDIAILKIVSNFFTAVRNRWPKAWDQAGPGQILSKTNGFRALIRFLRLLYPRMVEPGKEVSVEQFAEVLGKVRLNDRDFVIESFPPGSSGESALFKKLKQDTGIL